MSEESKLTKGKKVKKGTKKADPVINTSLIPNDTSVGKLEDQTIILP